MPYGVCQHAAKARTGSSDPADLLYRNLRFGQDELTVIEYLDLRHALRIAGPAFRQEQAKANHH